MVSWIERLSQNLPEVASPTAKRLSFSSKLKWTLAILIAYFVLGSIPLYALGSNSLQTFEFFSLILGASFGSIISLGIGPIVSASIILQLLNGSGILNLDLTTHEGRMRFEALQKLTTFGFIILESLAYVFSGAFRPALQGTEPMLYVLFLELFIVFQLIIGGVLIVLMDEVVSKWGFGSGVSLFIAAGVSREIFIRGLSILPSPQNPNSFVGALPNALKALLEGNLQSFLVDFSAIVATLVVFLVVVFLQSMRVEVPLTFGRIRGYGLRWPLNFLYVSNIPVILIAALVANIQLFGRMLQSAGYPILGTFSQTGAPLSGIAFWLSPVNLLQLYLTGGLSWLYVAKALVYVIFMGLGSMLFSIFWVKTAGLDAHSQAKMILASGLQVPGFRRDPRVIERILKRYIDTLTLLGGFSVGLIAALADLTGALAGGTSILLAVMIVYQFYESIAREHIMDMNPALRKFFQGS